MFSSLFANILYPLLASGLVVVVKYDLGKATAPQVAAFGSDLCVLALGAIVAVINNPLLLSRWGTESTINVGFGLGIVDACLVVFCDKITRSSWNHMRKAKVSFALGAFAISAAATINIVTYW